MVAFQPNKTNVHVTTAAVTRQKTWHSNQEEKDSLKQRKTDCATKFVFGRVMNTANMDKAGLTSVR
jgi:hypothetical protein